MNIIGILQLLRPHQWLKNLMIFFPPLLSGAMLQTNMAQRGIVPFLAFSLAASATYVFNDLQDLERDRRHPSKCFRPLPAGKVRRGQAIALMVFLLVVAGILGSQVSPLFLLLMGAYLLSTSLYSIALKDIAIIDVFFIALGFILRLFAGGEAFSVVISDWLFLTVFLLSLFLSLGKRQSEQLNLGNQAGEHRRTLEAYPEGFLENAMFVCAGAVIVTYAIYVVNKPHMVYTVPLCVFGLFRYLFRVKAGRSGDPTHALLRDRPLLITSFLWLVMVVGGIYH